jgi:hypothetical protein
MPGSIPDENRRSFLGSAVHACAAIAVGSGLAPLAEASTEGEKQRFLLVGLVGSENPTRANFPFVWAAALHGAGHEVRIELAGDATVLMRTVVADNLTPVGWPPFREALAKVIELKIPVFV